MPSRVSSNFPYAPDVSKFTKVPFALVYLEDFLKAQEMILILASLPAEH